MAGSLTDTGENEILDHLLGTGSFTSPTIYAALTTTVPTDSAAGTEVSGGSYARQSVAFDAASGGAADNTSTITYPTATANWGTVVGVDFYTASSGGTRIAWADLDTSKTVNNGDTFSFPAGDLDVTLS